MKLNNAVDAKEFDDVKIGQTNSIALIFTKEEVRKFNQLLFGHSNITDSVPELFLISAATSIDWKSGFSSVTSSYEAEFFLPANPGEKITIERKVTAKDGSKKTIHISLKAFNGKGELIGKGSSVGMLFLDAGVTK